MESSNPTNDVAPPSGETKNQANETPDCVGDLFGEQVRVRWRISDFPVVSSKVKGKPIKSPVFFSENGAWNLVMQFNEYNYCNYRFHEELCRKSYMGLYLCRVDSGPPKRMTFELDLINEEGEKLLSEKKTEKFSNTNEQKGWSTYCNDCYLEKKDYYRSPHNRLTIECTLAGAEEQLTDDSLPRRLWNLSLNLKDVFFSEENTDLALELKDGVAKAHGLIIRSRSVVLGEELRRCGEEAFEDASKDSFNVVLYYIYCGYPQGLSPDNAWEVYKLSHKYKLSELTKSCKDFLLAFLSADKVCDVILRAGFYQDNELLEGSKNYFAANREMVLKTDQWKAFKEGNSKIAIELLESSLNYEKKL